MAEIPKSQNEESLTQSNDNVNSIVVNSGVKRKLDNDNYEISPKKVRPKIENIHNVASSSNATTSNSSISVSSSSSSDSSNCKKPILNTSVNSSNNNTNNESVNYNSPSTNEEDLNSQQHRRENNNSTMENESSSHITNYTKSSKLSESQNTNHSTIQQNIIESNNNSEYPYLDLPLGYERRITTQGQVYYYHAPSNVSAWYDPRIPKDFHKQNLKLDTLGPLPNEWEQRQTASGQMYFIDHINRTTQYADPRLNANILYLIHHKIPPFDVITLNNSVSANCNATTISNDESNIDSLQLLLKSGNALPKYKSILLKKTRALQMILRTSQSKFGYCCLYISRDNIFENSYQMIMQIRPSHMRKILKVKFDREEGLDYGGLAREWLYLLSCEIINPQNGLFECNNNDNYILQINPNSNVNPDHLSYFQFVGRILGIALLHGHHLNCGFPTSFYKQLLKKQITLNDIVHIDPDLHRSLTWILENNITNIIDLTFSVENNNLGTATVHELKPSGSTIPVTEENKHEYVKLYISHRYYESIEQQLLALQNGFNELIPHHILYNFNEYELELIIGGISNIDVNDWRNNTCLKNCTAETVQIQWFWQIVESYTNDMRKRLLQFVTGSSRFPPFFRYVNERNKPECSPLFTIYLLPTASTENLPEGHTCFNRIDLPAYGSYKILYEKLTKAVEETSGFAMR